MTYKEQILKYVAGITLDGMYLWSAGYIVGALVGFLANSLFLMLVTIVLVLLFIAVRQAAVKRHGPRVNVSLSEELIVKLSDNTQV